MRKIRKFGTALALAAFMGTGMMASSARLYAAGPGTGSSTPHDRLCDFLLSAASSLDPNSELAQFLLLQYATYCTTTPTAQ